MSVSDRLVRSADLAKRSQTVFGTEGTENTEGTQRRDCRLPIADLLKISFSDSVILCAKTNQRICTVLHVNARGADASGRTNPPSDFRLPIVDCRLEKRTQNSWLSRYLAPFSSQNKKMAFLRVFK